MHQINPLLGLGGIYVLFYVFDDNIYKLAPESWKEKIFENMFELNGSLGVLLNLHGQKLSAYDLTSATLRICMLGYIIYSFTLKKGSWTWRKLKKGQPDKNRT